MLTDIADKDRMDEVSSHGYAWGYIGSCIPFIISLLLVLFYDKIGISMELAMGGGISPHCHLVGGNGFSSDRRLSAEKFYPCDKKPSLLGAETSGKDFF